MRNDMSYLELWKSYFSAEQSRLGNFGKGHCDDHFCEIIWISGSGGHVV